MTMARKVLPVLILVVALGAAFWWLSKRHEGGAAVLGGSGTIEGTTVEVTPKIAGRIAAVRVKEGDRVEKGAVVVDLAHDELDRQADAIAATIRAAEAMAGAAREQEAAVRVQADTARKNAERAEKLAASGSISAQALDVATAQRDALAAQLAAVRYQAGAAQAQAATAKAQAEVLAAQVANATLAAPIDGIVFTKNLEVGENAFPGSSVLTLVDDGDLWVKVYVTESMLGRVKVGMAAEVTVDSFPGKTFAGTVTTVSPQAEFTPKNVQTKEERVRLVYAVKVKVDSADGALKVGMPADVALLER
jgi:HlyD family secretion protein